MRDLRPLKIESMGYLLVYSSNLKTTYIPGTYRYVRRLSNGVEQSLNHPEGGTRYSQILTDP